MTFLLRNILHYSRMNHVESNSCTATNNAAACRSFFLIYVKAAAIATALLFWPLSPTTATPVLQACSHPERVRLPGHCNVRLPGHCTLWCALPGHCGLTGDGGHLPFSPRFRKALVSSWHQ